MDALERSREAPATALYCAMRELLHETSEAKASEVSREPVYNSSRGWAASESDEARVMLCSRYHVDRARRYPVSAIGFICRNQILHTATRLLCTCSLSPRIGDVAPPRAALLSAPCTSRYSADLGARAQE